MTDPDCRALRLRIGRVGGRLHSSPRVLKDGASFRDRISGKVNLRVMMCC